MKGKIIFKETQKFNKYILYFAVFFTVFFLLGPIYYGAWQQLVIGEPWGNEPMSDNGILLLCIVLTVFVIAIFTFIYIHKLVVEIDEGTIRYYFFPYFGSFRSVPKEKLKKAYVRKYRPVLEYGGWGYRWGFHKGKAYNIWGKWGLQLEFENDKKLLLGTQKPKELESAITQWIGKER